MLFRRLFHLSGIYGLGFGVKVCRKKVSDHFLVFLIQSSLQASGEFNLITILQAKKKTK